MASVEERVKQIIVEQLGVDEAEVTPTASFVDDLAPIRSTRWNWSWRLKRRSALRCRTRTRRR